MIYTITGPSGSGKTTLVRILMEKHPEKFRRVVTCTTRKPRRGEVDGEDYFFEERPAGGLAEWSQTHAASAEFDGNLYGIGGQSLASSDAASLLVILEPSGAREVARLRPNETTTVYIGVSEALAKRRLKKRRTRASRRQSADKEAGLFDRDGYDVVFENDGSAEELADKFFAMTEGEK